MFPEAHSYFGLDLVRKEAFAVPGRAAPEGWLTACHGSAGQATKDIPGKSSGGLA